MVCFISLIFWTESKLLLYRSETYRISLFRGYSSKTNARDRKEYATFRYDTVENCPKVTNKLVRFVDCAMLLRTI